MVHSTQQATDSSAPQFLGASHVTARVTRQEMPSLKLDQTSAAARKLLDSIYK